MSAVLSICLGYVLGCINPAAWVGKKKHVDLSKTGTKNLGATNTALVLGKKAGYFVLCFDMSKSVISYKVAKYLFPALRIAGILAALGVILGHCFPITMGFQGGKGLASFGGLVLVHDPAMFCLLLTIGILAALVMDYGVYLAVTASILFPITSWLRSHDIAVFLSTAAASGLIFAMHWTNLKRAIRHEDPINIRAGLRKIFGRKQK